MAKLSNLEQEHYAAQGWVVPSFRLPKQQITTMVDVLYELIRRNPNVRPEKLVSAHVERTGGANNGEGVRGVGGAGGFRC